MCVNFVPASKRSMKEVFNAPVPDEWEWPAEAYKDYQAPIIVADARERRKALLAGYGIVPRRHIPKGVKAWDTMNARAETIGSLRSYASAWRTGRLCLCPMSAFFEPNWETGEHVRWKIGMEDQADFAVAGLWRQWTEADGSMSYAFTQITINADEHPLMRRFHRSNDEKRSLVILPTEDYDAWLTCRDPEVARSFLLPFPAERMAAMPAPKPPRAKQTVQENLI
jgi:putative SOS response-associated peptidase YedK